MKGKGTFLGGWGERRVLIFPGLVNILLALFRARATSAVEVDSLNCKRGDFNVLASVQCKPSLFRLNNMYGEARLLCFLFPNKS